MNVRCPHCETTFRVDPERIPAAGIKARCSRCSAIFELTRQGAQPARPAAAPAAAPAAPVMPAVPPAAPPRLSVSSAPPAAHPTPSAAPPAPKPGATATQVPPAPAAPRPLPPRMPPAAPPTATAASSVAAVPEAGTSAKRPSFRNQDPGARAQRLARALVSDIVAYNKEKLAQTTSVPALRSEFREEIRKSWEEYVEQVGLELAKGTPYFRDALNEILARGQKVF